MKPAQVLGLLLLLSLPAVAHEKNPDPDRSGKLIVNVFEKFHSSQDMVRALTDASSPEDQKDLKEYLKTHPNPILPKVSLRNHTITMNFNGHVETLSVVDGRRSIFSLRGEEIDLGTQRPLRERLKDVDEVLSEKEESWMARVLPSARAAEPERRSIGLISLGEVVPANDEVANAQEAGFALMYIDRLCGEVKMKSSDFYRVFDENVTGELRKRKPRPQPPIKGWQTTTLKYVRAVAGKYCGAHSNIGSFIGTEYSITVDSNCHIAHVVDKCLQEIENGTQALYPEYGLELQRWLDTFQVQIDLPKIATPMTAVK